MCPIFHGDDGEDKEGTFGPSMSAALSLHRDKKEKKDGKDSKEEHLKKAKHHLDKAIEGHEGMEHAEEEDMGGGGIGSLLSDEEE